MALNTPPRRAFSLVELLIVLAVIGLLTVILLPTLRSAASTADRAVCLSNLTQLHLAFTLYADDHGGLAPDEESNITWDGLIWPYLPDERVYHCPSYPGEFVVGDCDYAWRDSFWVDALSPGASLAGVKLFELPRSDLVYLFETDPGWHGPGTIAAASLDGSTKFWNESVFIENMAVVARPGFDPIADAVGP